MKLAKAEARDLTNAYNRASIHGAERRTLEAIFRHPVASNLEWMDVAGLVARIGSMQERGGGEFDLHIGGKHHLMHKPKTKDLTGSEVVDLRHFLQEAGWSPEAPSEAATHPDPVAPTLVVLLDHHGAKIYRIDLPSGIDSQPQIHPYDPNGLLHKLAHKVHPESQVRHETEKMARYKRIADAVAAGGKIIVVANGKAMGDEARELTGFLRTHHRQAYQRAVSDLTTDIPDITQPQLLALAGQVLNPAT